MISIVMTYYNRKEQLEYTLKSIFKYVHNDYEIIIVDDCSDENQRIEYLTEKYHNIKIIRLERKDKWYVNSCVPFNVGIKNAIGDIIVLQNSECFYVGDVLKYIKNNLTELNYISFAAYSLNKEDTEKAHRVNKFRILPKAGSRLSSGWFNHPVYRPVYYHFCSAITRNNMSLLNGFDEKFAKGIAYDDNEFVERVTKLGLQKEIPTDVFVVHQWHTKIFPVRSEYLKMLHRNKTLFNSIKNE